MFKKLRVVTVVALAAFAATVGVGGLMAADDKVPDISTIMKKSFGKGGLKGGIASAVKGEKWDDAAKLADEWKAMGAALGKNKQEKGEADSWKKLCAKFADNTAAVADAVGKKDAKAASAALGKVGSSCKECHDIHKP